MENLRGFKVETIQATNTNPVRVKITDLRFDKSKILSYGWQTPNTEKELIVWYLGLFGITILSQCWHENKEGRHIYSIYLSDNFTNKIN